MHWGHAVSEDLVHWEHQDIALFPTKYEDQNGCFSGSAIEHEGVMNIFYTGVHYDKINPEDTHMCLDDEFQSAQLRITSEDGIHFDNFRDKQVIIPAIEDAEIGDRTHTRDPKVWRGSDAWYLVLGSSTADRKGELLFYKSMDLENWEFVNATSTEEHLGTGSLAGCGNVRIILRRKAAKYCLFLPWGSVQREPGKRIIRCV